MKGSSSSCDVFIRDRLIFLASEMPFFGDILLDELIKGDFFDDLFFKGHCQHK